MPFAIIVGVVIIILIAWGIWSAQYEMELLYEYRITCMEHGILWQDDNPPDQAPYCVWCSWKDSPFVVLERREQTIWQII